MTLARIGTVAGVATGVATGVAAAVVAAFGAACADAIRVGDPFDFGVDDDGL